jgi:GntR family transcriptional repressor for pyruvate dehydrogenase complex
MPRKLAENETLGQGVARRLLSDIRTGIFPQGQKLPPERELMTRYSVGRNTLREAIQGVVALGLLEVRAGSGTTVKKVDAHEAVSTSVAASMLAEPAVNELLEFRLLIEPQAAIEAAGRADDADLAAIREALADYQDAVRRMEDVYARDLAFHRAIASASHNGIFLAVIDTTAQLLEVAMRDADRAPGDVSEAAAEHALIAHYVLLGDAQGAQDAMRSHLLAGNNRRNRPAAESPEP